MKKIFIILFLCVNVSYSQFWELDYKVNKITKTKLNGKDTLILQNTKSVQPLRFFNNTADWELIETYVRPNNEVIGVPENEKYKIGLPIRYKDNNEYKYCLLKFITNNAMGRNYLFFSNGVPETIQEVYLGKPEKVQIIELEINDKWTGYPCKIDNNNFLIDSLIVLHFNTKYFWQGGNAYLSAISGLTAVADSHYVGNTGIQIYKENKEWLTESFYPSTEYQQTFTNSYKISNGEYLDIKVLYPLAYFQIQAENLKLYLWFIEE